MAVEKIEFISDEIVESVQKLVPYLGLHKPIPSFEDLSLLLSNSSFLLVVRHPEQSSPIVGMLTLSIYRVPTGVRSIIEDVVVEPNFRGFGLAKKLLNEAIRLARESGADHISLTSNPNRIEANYLYLKMGFERRNTNVYHYELEQK